MRDELILQRILDNQDNMSNDISALSREVGEIKAELSTKHKSKAKGYTKVGLFISSGVLLSKLIDMAGIF